MISSIQPGSATIGPYSQPESASNFSRTGQNFAAAAATAAAAAAAAASGFSNTPFGNSYGSGPGIQPPPSGGPHHPGGDGMHPNTFNNSIQFGSRGIQSQNQSYHPYRRS